MNLKANSDHINGKQLVILFEKCVGLADCYDHKTVKTLMRGKSIVLFANQRTFSENDIESPFVEESKFIWVPIGPEMIEDNFFSLEVG